VEEVHEILVGELGKAWRAALKNVFVHLYQEKVYKSIIHLLLYTCVKLGLSLWWKSIAESIKICPGENIWT
jgi:hypothetical protein